MRFPRLRASFPIMLAAVAATLSGCTMVPAYHRPVVKLPAAWRNGVPDSAAAAPVPGWWKGFGSAQLDADIKQASAQNLDIAAAIARVREADAQAQIAGAPLLPSIGASGGGTEARMVRQATGRQETYHEGEIGADASYEVDFWGKNRAALNAAKESAVAARYDQQVVALAVTSGVAMTYFQTLALQDRISVAEQNLQAAQKTLADIEAQFASGTTTSLSVAQQQTVVDGLQAAIPPLRYQLTAARDSLGILLGEPPEDVRTSDGSLLSLAMPAVAAGLPASLLTRRPDVAQAEANLIAANFNIGVARAAFLPSFDLTASGGVAALGLASFMPPIGIFGLAAGLTQPIFEGGALHGQLNYDKARYAELLADYRKSVISALGNVEDALAAVQRTGQQLDAETALVDAARRAYDAAEAQYSAGATDLLTVLTAETTLFQGEDMLIQVRLAHAQALVGLYQALGGGWQENGAGGATSATMARAQ